MVRNIHRLYPSAHTKSDAPVRENKLDECYNRGFAELLDINFPLITKTIKIRTNTKLYSDVRRAVKNKTESGKMDMGSWMALNLLKSSEEKTELILFSRKQNCTNKTTPLRYISR